MTDQRMTEIRHPIGASGSLDLRNVTGRVRLAGTEGGEAIVIVRSERGDAPELNVERGDGSLLVEPQRERGGLFGGLSFSRSGGLEFDVRLPRGARLDVKTVNADIDGRELFGEQHYKTVSADLRLAGVGGRISFMTVSGDVRIHGAATVELDGATTSGDVTAEAQAVARLGVRTVSGDIRVSGHLLPGPRHAVETVSGDLVLDVVGGVSLESRRALDLGRERGPAIYGDGSARLTFRSMSGDHRVSVRAAGADAPDIGQPRDPWDAGRPTAEASATRSTTPSGAASEQRLEILRALERGEIDVEEATRRLEASPNA